jgi:hypothetical protein
MCNRRGLRRSARLPRSGWRLYRSRTSGQNRRNSRQKTNREKGKGRQAGSQSRKGGGGGGGRRGGGRACMQCVQRLFRVSVQVVCAYKGNRSFETPTPKPETPIRNPNPGPFFAARARSGVRCFFGFVFLGGRPPYSLTPYTLRPTTLHPNNPGGRACSLRPLQPGLDTKEPQEQEETMTQRRFYCGNDRT